MRNRLEKIVSQSGRNPTMACTMYFPNIYKRSLYRKIVHPLQWARYASKVEGLMIDQEEGDSSVQEEVERNH